MNRLIEDAFRDLARHRQEDLHRDRDRVRLISPSVERSPVIEERHLPVSWMAVVQGFVAAPAEGPRQRPGSRSSSSQA